MRWHMHNGAERDMLGLIPDFLHDMDPRPAAEQFDENYAHGGGWRPLEGKWKLELAMDGDDQPFSTTCLRYPGDRPFRLVAHTNLHLGSGKPEQVLVFDCGPWIVIRDLTSGDWIGPSRMD